MKAVKKYATHHCKKLLLILCVGSLVCLMYWYQNLETFEYPFKPSNLNYVGKTDSNGMFARVFGDSPTPKRKTTFSDKYILECFDEECETNNLTFKMPIIAYDRTPKMNKSFSVTSEEMSICPEVPPDLIGRIPISSNDTNPPFWSDIANANPRVLEGGRYSPEHCTARFRVAIIIALRDRETQLRSLLAHMHPIWQRQQIDYTVFTITQGGTQIFNKAKLLNVGFTEASKDRKYDCFVFHDVDLKAENDECLYWCLKDNPRIITAFMDKFGYNSVAYDLLCGSLDYEGKVKYFGGGVMMTAKQMQAVNGYSNLYWGWGGEDDDLYMRVRNRGYEIQNPYDRKCSYHMIKHQRESSNTINPVRNILLYHAIPRMDEEGLNNLRYKILKYEKSALYTNITVDVGHRGQKLKDFMLYSDGKCNYTVLPWDI